MDKNCEGYIEYASSLAEETVLAEKKTPGSDVSGESNLQEAVIKGLKDMSASITTELIKSKNPLDIISDEIIPALDKVGMGFENKTVYLPQLLMSAEAAKSAFDVIKSVMDGGKSAGKGTVVIATVKGDIHDIGKNIVKLLLENYGFDTIDLGKDVPPEEICRIVVEKKAPAVGLSALMTTTVPAMEETIRLLKEKAPWCRVIVGGAVLNKEYADMIGADFYAKDAMEGVRFAEEICR